MARDGRSGTDEAWKEPEVMNQPELGRLLAMIDSLMVRDPWTRSTRAAKMLSYMRNEAAEVDAELETLNAATASSSTHAPGSGVTNSTDSGGAGSKEAEGAAGAGAGAGGTDTDTAASSGCDGGADAEALTPAARAEALAHLEDELGDLLFCSLMVASLAARDHGADPQRIYKSMTAKLERRCPYVFGPDAKGVATVAEAKAHWQRAKAVEAADAASTSGELPATGLEVCAPWTERLMDGDKTVETRAYELPADLVGTPMALIESQAPRPPTTSAASTAGAGVVPDAEAGVDIDGDADGSVDPRHCGIVGGRIVGVITFGDCIHYETRAAWVADAPKHLVPLDSQRFGFQEGVPKYGWPVVAVARLAAPLPLPPLERIVRSVFRILR